MSSSSDQLTFLEDKALLIISSLGLVCVGTAVLWVVRQSPDWGGRIAPLDGEEDGDAALLGTRTRVVPGGREATKAARKEAKKRAKADFRRSEQSSAAQERRNRLQTERKRKVKERYLPSEDEGGFSEVGFDSAPDLSRQLERHIMENKVSSLTSLERELGTSSADIVTRINELETSGKFTGVVVDDARGDSSFVRVTLEEMRTISDFVEQKGRLTLEELAAEANMVLELSNSREEAGVEVEGDVCREEVATRRDGTTEQARRTEAILASATATGAKAPSLGHQEDVVSVQPAPSAVESCM